MMRYAISFVMLALIIAAIIGLLSNKKPDLALDATQATHPMKETTTLPAITPIEHASFVMTWADAVLYADPVGGHDPYAMQPSPTIIFLTDIHGDHLDTATLESLVTATTIIVAPQAVADELPTDLRTKTTVLGNGETASIQGFTFEATPMYNHPDAANSNFHPKGRGNGYVIERDGVRVYVAGDTAGTPEMRALKDIDIAFIPMNLPYTMDVEEAADAVLAFAPKTVYPYHYRGPGGLSDVARFKTLVNEKNPAIEVGLLSWYPQQ